MKLIIAIVQDNDAAELIEVITEAGLRVTKLATTGGFLKAGNTTLIIGVQADKVDKVISMIGETCKTREQIIATPSPVAGATEVYIPFPVEIQVGGATIFVIDVDKFVKF